MSQKPTVTYVKLTLERGSRENISSVVGKSGPASPKASTKLDDRFVGNKSAGAEMHLLEKLTVDEHWRTFQRMIVCGPLKVLLRAYGDRSFRHRAKMLLRSAGYQPYIWKTYDTTNKSASMLKANDALPVKMADIIQLRFQVEVLDPLEGARYEPFAAVVVDNEHFFVVKSLLTNQPEFYKSDAQLLVESYVAYRDGHPITVESSKGIDNIHKIVRCGEEKRIFSVELDRVVDTKKDDKE